MTNDRVFKLLLVGDAGIGKTAFVKRVLGFDFEKSYISTFGINICEPTLKFSYDSSSNVKGTIDFEIWDCSGKENLTDFKTELSNIDCAICMYDCCEPVSQINAEKWIRSLSEIIPNIPLTTVANKCDKLSVFEKHDHNITTSTFLCSAKFAVNLYAPFNILAHKLLKDESLILSHQNVDNIINSMDIVIKPQKTENKDDTLKFHKPFICNDLYEPSSSSSTSTSNSTSSSSSTSTVVTQIDSLTTVNVSPNGDELTEMVTESKLYEVLDELKEDIIDFVYDNFISRS